MLVVTVLDLTARQKTVQLLTILLLLGEFFLLLQFLLQPHYCGIFLVELLIGISILFHQGTT